MGKTRRNKPKSSNTTATEHHAETLEFDDRCTRIALWLACTLDNPQIIQQYDEHRDLESLLNDGTIMCRLLQALHPERSIKVHNKKDAESRKLNLQTFIDNASNVYGDVVSFNNIKGEIEMVVASLETIANAESKTGRAVDIHDEAKLQLFYSKSVETLNKIEEQKALESSWTTKVDVEPKPEPASGLRSPSLHSPKPKPETVEPKPETVEQPIVEQPKTVQDKMQPVAESRIESKHTRHDTLKVVEDVVKRVISIDTIDVFADETQDKEAAAIEERVVTMLAQSEVADAAEELEQFQKMIVVGDESVQPAVPLKRPSESPVRVNAVIDVVEELQGPIASDRTPEMNRIAQMEAEEQEVLEEAAREQDFQDEMDTWLDITRDGEEFACTPKSIFDSPAGASRLQQPKQPVTPVVVRNTSASPHHHDIVCLVMVKMNCSAPPQRVWVTGEAPEFGHWDLEHSPVMCNMLNSDVWAVQVTLSASIATNSPRSIPFKCVASWGDSNLWESGPNRSLVIPSRGENWSLFTSPRWADELPPCVIAVEFRYSEPVTSPVSMIFLKDWRHKRSTIELTFVVGPYGPEDGFCGIIGSAPELGAWDANRAVMLESTDQKGNQTVTISLDPEYCMKNALEYKYIVRTQEQVQVPAAGDTKQLVNKLTTKWETGENRKLENVLKGAICWCFGSARICVSDNDVQL